MRLSAHLKSKPVKKECGPIISTYDAGNGVLFRGVGKIVTISKFKSHIKDRKPMSTVRWLHDDLNKWFTQKFGWPARNGVGAYNYESDAAIYGYPYVFYPVGKLKFVWSPDVSDLWGTVVSHAIRERKHFKNLIPVLETYTDKNLEAAMESHCEIYFNCNEYYLTTKEIARQWGHEDR